MDDKKIADKVRELIPKGPYCHGGCVLIDGKPVRTDICIFWGYDKNRDEMECGFCLLTGANDWGPEGDYLLWDQCKCCGINDDDDDVYK